MSLHQFNQLSWMANDAAMQTRIQDFITNMVAAGLIRTTDTGQINELTVTRPTAQNTSKGYLMFRFNDALQGTKPIFIKVEVITCTHIGAFNNGTTNVTGNWGEVPVYKFSVGVQTDGAGNFVGRSVSPRVVGYHCIGTAVANVTNSNNSGTNKSAIMADMGSNARFMYYWGLETAQGMSSDSSGWAIGATTYPSNGNPGMGFFCVERSKDANGDDTGDGFAVLTAGYPLFNTQGGGTQWNTHGTHYSVYFPFTRPTPLPTKYFWNTANNQSDERLSSLWNNELGMITHYPQEGMRIHNPLISIGGYYTGDYQWDGATPSPVKMYGTDRDYRPLGGHNLHIHYNTRLYQLIYPMVIWG